MRAKTVSLLGGIAPISALYLLASIDFYLNPPVGEEGLGIWLLIALAPWAYVFALIVGTGLAFTSRPEKLAARFFLSAFLASFLFVAAFRLIT